MASLLDNVTGNFETVDGRIGVEGRPSVLRVKTRNGSVHAQIDGDRSWPTTGILRAAMAD
jgi:hypothetical protein